MQRCADRAQGSPARSRRPERGLGQSALVVAMPWASLDWKGPLAYVTGLMSKGRATMARTEDLVLVQPRMHPGSIAIGGCRPWRLVPV